MSGGRIWCQLLGSGHSLPASSDCLTIVVSFITATSDVAQKSSKLSQCFPGDITHPLNWVGHPKYWWPLAYYWTTLDSSSHFDETRSSLRGQAKPSQSSNWGGGDLREAQVDVPLSTSHSCVWSQSWAQEQTPNL